MVDVDLSQKEFYIPHVQLVQLFQVFFCKKQHIITSENHAITDELPTIPKNLYPAIRAIRCNYYFFPS